MNNIIRQDIIKILNGAIELVERDKVRDLRDLSDQVIHNASIFQDEDSIYIAVIIYTISKIYKAKKDISPETMSLLKEAKAFLEQDDVRAYRSKMKFLFSILPKKDANRVYLEEVLKIAQIKKASRIIYHGISLPRVAACLDISRWDLMNYIGKTTITDSFGDSNNIEAKLSFTRSLFKR